MGHRIVISVMWVGKTVSKICDIPPFSGEVENSRHKLTGRCGVGVICSDRGTRALLVACFTLILR